MKATGYQIFLMIELAKVHNVLDSEREYDTQWEHGNSLIKEFNDSEFNNPEEPEYECMEKFLIKSVEDDDHRSEEDELDLNIQALEASENGNMGLSNALWSVIELKEYKRLDYTMTLYEMVRKSME